MYTVNCENSTLVSQINFLLIVTLKMVKSLSFVNLLRYSKYGVTLEITTTVHFNEAKFTVFGNYFFKILWEF